MVDTEENQMEACLELDVNILTSVSRGPGLGFPAVTDSRISKRCLQTTFHSISCFGSLIKTTLRGTKIHFLD